MIKACVIGMIRIYQAVLSPLKMPTCRFHPSCSEYCIQAVRTRGVVLGTVLGIWRILRCNPLSRGGYDPVPPGRVEKPGRVENEESG